MDYIINSKIHENHDSFIVGFNRWIKKEDLYILKKSKKQPFPIIISTQNLFCVIYIEKSWQSKSHRQRSKYSTFFYILLHYLLHPADSSSIGSSPKQRVPILRRFFPSKDDIDSPWGARSKTRGPPTLTSCNFLHGRDVRRYYPESSPREDPFWPPTSRNNGGGGL